MFFTAVHKASGSLVQLIGSGIVFLAILYGLSFVVRHFGKVVEPTLWRQWDGAPSTRFLRWRDSTFGDDLKKRIRSAVEKLCHITLMSQEEEEKNPEAADSQIEQAFMQVRSIIRRYDPTGVWMKHNAEYGFARNLMGSRVMWFAFSILGTIVCGIFWYYWKDQIFLIGLLFNTLIVIAAIICGWVLLLKITKESADRYAESAWNSFLTLANLKENGIN